MFDSIHQKLSKLSENDTKLVLAIVLYMLAQENGKSEQAIEALKKVVES